jgi:general secretion pathway protein A
MYINYFQLSENPFSLTPDPRYLFMSERHREGLAHMLYGVQQPGGFVQLTGEIGSGKTTLCRCLIKQLPPDTEVALVLNPRLTAIELLATVCDELRIPYPAETSSIKVFIDALNRHLLEAHAQGRRTVLIIDEAQNLHPDVLEQVRLLTNLETSQEKLLQIILIGQPELLSLLNGKKLRQLAQRITARYHLQALSRPETYAYIRHRLLVAGRRDPLFSNGALRWVYRVSRGMPRVINVVCDRALLGAYARDKRRISAAIVRRASRETQGLASRYRRLRLATVSGIVLLLILTIGGTILLGPNHLPFLRPNSESIATEASSSYDAKSAEGRDAAGRMESKPRLMDILADAAQRGNAHSGFASLFAIWGIQPAWNTSETGCEAAESQGMECLSQEGSWLKLRRYNLPAILETVLPNGARHRIALVGLEKDRAILTIGERQYSFPLSEIDGVWDGSFILLWKPPFKIKVLSRGSRGSEVLWIRAALDQLEGKEPSPAPSDLLDKQLEQRIIAFQREQSLVPDGFVGSETLVRLTLALEGAKAPSLSPSAY